MYFLLSTIALLAGPFVYAVGRRNKTTERLLDVLIIAAIAWIIGVHIVPDAVEAAGWPALAVLVLGMAFPYVLRRIFHLASKAMHTTLLVIAALALVLHAVIDGIALLPASGEQLSTAVILHRLPVGMAIWWTFRPAIGTRAAVASFVLIISATALAIYFGGPVIELAESRMLALFQVFVAGSLADMVIVGLRDMFRKSPSASD
jgi:zinc transporter ZupT